MTPLACPILAPIPVLLFSLLLLTANATDSTCDRAHYGKPRFNDCYQLLAYLPYQRGANPRLFVEQQLREVGLHSWVAVDNPYTDAVVQIPKYWTYKTCNFALLSFSPGPGAAATALATTSWKSANAAANQVLKICLVDALSGGATVVPSVTDPTKPALTLFVWETGHEFETLLNQYQNQPQPVPILPPGSSNWLVGGGSGGLGSGSRNESDVRASS